MIARDVYGCHYEELSSQQRGHVAELLALRIVESEFMEAAIERIKSGAQ